MLKRLFSVEAVCATLLVVLAALMSVQVFTRYVLNYPLTWAEEIVAMSFTWLCFLGAVVALKNRGHIGLTFLAELLPPALRKVWIAMIGLVVTGFLGILVYAGVKMTMLVHFQLSAALEVPMSLFYAALPVSALLMIYHELAHVVAVWKESHS
jgi:TRAP-type C4-dicarboxylate transport system permease small subunit